MYTSLSKRKLSFIVFGNFLHKPLQFICIKFSSFKDNLSITTLDVLPNEFGTCPSNYCKIKVCSAYGKQVEPSQNHREIFFLATWQQTLCLMQFKGLR